MLVAMGSFCLAQESSTNSIPSIEELLSNGASDEELFASWPSVREVVRAAEAALPRTLRKSHHWNSRQKLATLLPRIRVGRGVSEHNYDRYLLERDPQDRNRLDDFTLEDGIRDYDSESLWLQWDLSELLFHNDELEMAVLEKNISDFKHRLGQSVIDAYFKLKEARLKLARNVATTEEGRIQLMMSAEAHQALLDEYTDGFFTKTISRREGDEAGR